jgi:transposase
MSYISGEKRGQAALLPAAIEDYVAADAPVRVIDAFVNGLDARGLGFGRAVPAAMGRPPYDPRDLVKLYLYGYLNEVRSSRRLERECSRNLEVMWLLRRLAPDFKTIADFRRDNGAAIVGSGVCDVLPGSGIIYCAAGGAWRLEVPGSGKRQAHYWSARDRLFGVGIIFWGLTILFVSCTCGALSKVVANRIEVKHGNALSRSRQNPT